MYKIQTGTNRKEKCKSIGKLKFTVIYLDDIMTKRNSYAMEYRSGRD